jgi:hypothetical protein
LDVLRGGWRGGEEKCVRVFAAGNGTYSFHLLTCFVLTFLPAYSICEQCKMYGGKETQVSPPLRLVTGEVRRKRLDVMQHALLFNITTARKLA